MNIIWTLFKKEILDILRDKKTLIMMIIVPIILYPLIMIGATMLVSTLSASQYEKEYVVALSNTAKEDQKIFEELYKSHEEDIEYKISFINEEFDEEKLNNNEIHAFISKEEGKTEDTDHYTIQYLSADMDSSTVVLALNKLFSYFEEMIRIQRLDKYNLEESILYPISFEEKDLSSMQDNLSVNMGGIIGLLIIMTIFMGAIYPTIDVTAGEKERGTLETLLTLPVSNLQLILSKFLSVALITCITTFLSLLSLGGSVFFMISQFATAFESTGFEISIDGLIPGFFILLVLLITLAFFISALCMSVCLFAKNFKEANNYITPVMLFIMFGAYPAMLPNLNLSIGTALIPILNVALTVKELFAMEFSYGLYGVVFLSNLSYSLLIIWLLAKMYHSENVLFKDGFTGFRIFDKRSEIKHGGTPSWGDAMFLLCVVLLLVLYIGTAATIHLGFGGVFIQQGIILLCPLAFAWYIKSDFKETFSLRKCAIKDFLGCFCLWVGSYPLILILSSFLSEGLSKSSETLEQSFEVILAQPTLFLVFGIALLPAIGEEIFFRGFFFKALGKKMKFGYVIILVSGIFAMFHFSLVKLIPTFILGLVLTYSVYKSKSIYCSMVIHFINNFLAVLGMKYPNELGEYLPILMKDALSLIDYVICIVISIIGFAFAYLLLKRKRNIQ